MTKSFSDKKWRKIDNLSSKSVFWTSKQPFAVHFFPASSSICPVAIPEIFSQIQGSDDLQLIYSLNSPESLCSTVSIPHVN